MPYLFNHERLKVYQRSLEFIEWADPHIEDIPPSYSVKKQLDRASTSIPLNIAEGNGKWSKKDRCRFFDIAHGSALECAAALDIAVVKKAIEKSTVESSKLILQEVVNMLIGLIKANDPDRDFGSSESMLGEEGVDYVEGD